jgi:phosphonoacetaldehyde dehydrogenase
LAKAVPGVAWIPGQARDDSMSGIATFIRDHHLDAMRIAGRQVGAGREGGIEVFNPFSAERIGTVPKATLEEVRQAFDSAHAFQPRLTRYDRAAILNKAAAIVRERLDEIAHLITAESGLCLKDAIYEAGRVSDVLLFGANEVLKDDGQIFSCDLTPHGKKRRVYTQRSPLLGVITAITPFNHPMNQVAHKVVPSIATNNRMVLKPSEKVPFSAILFADILYRAGLPPEMLSIVTGDPRQIADELITNAKVDLVTFTGGVAIGKYIAGKAGYRRVVLELGGNDPIIVMEDADIDEASTLAVQGSYKNSGQRCTAVKRMLVHDAVAARFTEQVVEKTRAWTFGDPLDKANDMGTVIDEAAAALFEARVDEAVRQGAKVLVGNRRQGALYSPTVIDGVRPEMTLVNEESFGPVSPIIRFKSIEEAIHISNGTAYGLSSSVCTNRLDYITRFVNELQVGSVNVREVPGYRLELTPFGGIKDSGLGYKEGVQEAMKSFTNLKTYSLPWP